MSGLCLFVLTDSNNDNIYSICIYIIYIVKDCNVRIVTAPQNSHLRHTVLSFPGICKDEPTTYVSL